MDFKSLKIRFLFNGDSYVSIINKEDVYGNVCAWWDYWFDDGNGKYTFQVAGDMRDEKYPTDQNLRVFVYNFADFKDEDRIAEIKDIELVPNGTEFINQKHIDMEHLQRVINIIEKSRKLLLGEITRKVCELTDYGKQTIEFNISIPTTEELGEIMNIGAVDYGMSLVSVNEYGEDVCVNDYLPIDSLLAIAFCLIKGNYTIIEN